MFLPLDKLPRRQYKPDRRNNRNHLGTEAGTEEEWDVVANADSKTLSLIDLVQEGPSDFRVHSSVYTDQGIFEQEMHDIFENGWIYVAPRERGR